MTAPPLQEAGLLPIAEVGVRRAFQTKRNRCSSELWFGIKSRSARKAVTEERGQMVGLIRQFPRFGDGPQRDDCFGGYANRGSLRDDQETGARLPSGQMVAEVVEHGPPIARKQNAALGRDAVEKFRIANAVQASLLRRRKADGRFLAPNRLNDGELEVVVRLEPQAQTRDSSGLAGEAAARAFWIRSQREGLASEIGMPLPSNSRSVSFRSRSISAR